MAKSPAFQWYPKDCDTDENVRLMDDRELGVYVRCLNHAWLNDGLPNNITEIARLLNRPKSYTEKVWARVGRCFIVNDSGRLVNSRQEKERLLQSEHSSAKSEAGARGAAKRWQGHSSAKDLPLAKNSSSSATASASPPPTPSGGGGPNLRTFRHELSDDTSLWNEFRAACDEAKIPGSEPDFVDAKEFWLGKKAAGDGKFLTPEDRLKCITEIRQRAISSPDDSLLKALPVNILRRKMFDRRARDPSKSREQEPAPYKPNYYKPPTLEDPR